MRKNLYVLEILQYFCHDKNLVEFFSKDEILIGLSDYIRAKRVLVCYCGIGGSGFV